MNSSWILSLMDQTGAPAHPALFLVLGVVTFSLHIAAVGLTLGTLLLALFGAFSSNPYWQRLCGTLGFTAKVAVGAAVVLGVAPLLFVQVIYDPFWYVSNVLSAWPAILFLAALMVGYLLLYVWYGANHDYAADGTPIARKGEVKGGVWLLIALALFLVCGFIMHALAYQELLPGEWMNWYAPNGHIDPSGTSLHQASLPRLAFMLLMALPITSGWIYALRGFIKSRGEADAGYLDFLSKLGCKVGLAGAVLAAIAFGAWMYTLPETMAWFATSAWVAVGIVGVILFFVVPPMGKKEICCPYAPFGVSLVAVILVAVAREALRYGTLASAVGWHALDYKLVMDWGSLIVFFFTFLAVGLVSLLYLALLAWKSGQAKGQVTIGPKVTAVGRLSVALLGFWIVAYFVIGAFYIYG
jgi:hypothetical protein